ncbi:hypothetical protein pipiens_012205 [Culex pipiens pipiens]|uniref:Endonuclease/exonuclease/phosphatase domain-containing protein n=1 Tax=Culex pipiens pipiens TaxID=38569 RepID=A0ABD1D4M2_CULPP
MADGMIRNTLVFRFPQGASNPSLVEMARFIKALDADRETMETSYKISDERCFCIKFKSERAMKDALLQNPECHLFQYSNGSTAEHQDRETQQMDIVEPQTPGGYQRTVELIVEPVTPQGGQGTLYSDAVKDSEGKQGCTENDITSPIVLNMTTLVSSKKLVGVESIQQLADAPTLPAPMEAALQQHGGDPDDIQLESAGASPARSLEEGLHYEVEYITPQFVMEGIETEGTAKRVLTSSDESANEVDTDGFTKVKGSKSKSKKLAGALEAIAADSTKQDNKPGGGRGGRSKTKKVCSINLNAISIEAKKYLLKDFVIRHDVDVALLQEVAFSNFSFIPTHHAVVNRSSTNVGTAILIRKTLPFDETLMDPNGRITSIAFDSINVINVYGHSGSQAKAEREDLYEDRIIAHMDKPKTRHVLLGGDHNCILEADDCKSKNKPLSQALQALVSGYQLRDVGLPGRRFTFHRGESASRLDRMYTDKTLAGRITKFETLPVAFSDHHAILATYTIVRDDATPAVGRGYWKINDYLLRDPETTAGFREALVELKQRRKYTNSFSEWWSYDFKNKVKQFYKGKAIQFNQTNSVRKARFHKRLEELTEKQAEAVSLVIGIVTSQQHCSKASG